MKKNFFVAALTALALVSCHEQSELNFEDITGSATIKGTVTYDPGYNVEGDNYIKSTVPAAGITVVASVGYNQYDAEATGTKRFEATTNANGEFSFSIPVGQQAISVSVQPRGFEAKYNGNLDRNDDVMPTTAFYQASATSVSVANGDVRVLPTINMTAGTIADITSRNVEVTVTGEVLRLIEAPTRESATNTINGAERGTDVAACKVQITFSNSNSDDELIFNDIALDNNGKYQLTAKLYDVWNLATTTVTVKAQEYVVEDFAHYYQNLNTAVWHVQPLAGLYQTNSTSAKLTANNAYFECKVSAITMSFVPADKTSILGIGNRDLDYDENGYKIYGYSNPLNF